LLPCAFIFGVVPSIQHPYCVLLHPPIGLGEGGGGYGAGKQLVPSKFILGVIPFRQQPYRVVEHVLVRGVAIIGIFGLIVAGGGGGGGGLSVT